MWRAWARHPRLLRVCSRSVATVCLLVLSDYSGATGRILATRGLGSSRQGWERAAQAMVCRRALVLLDGFDEAGGKQSLAEEFLRDQLLALGFPVLFSSRYTGFDASRLGAQFVQYEIKDLGPQQQAAMATHQLGEGQAGVFLEAFAQKAAEDEAFRGVGASVHTYSMLVALFKRDGKFCSSKGELYRMILMGASDRLDEAQKQFVMDEGKLEFFRSLSLQSHTRTEQLRNISLPSIREWGLPEDMWVIINEAERAGRLPFWEPVDEDPGKHEYRFAQITYQEWFVADLLVAETCKGGSAAAVLKHGGEPIELFGVVKWHNVTKSRGRKGPKFLVALQETLVCSSSRATSTHSSQNSLNSLARFASANSA